MLELRPFRVHGRQRPLEGTKALVTTLGQIEPNVLGAGDLLARRARKRSHRDHVIGDRLGRRDERRQLERTLHRLNAGADGRANGHVVQHLATESVIDLRAALGHLANLQVDAGGELLDRRSTFHATLADRLEQRTDGSPENAQVALGRHALDARNGVPHCLRAFLVAAQPGEERLAQSPRSY